MDKSDSILEMQITRAARAFPQRRMGRAPGSATAVPSDDWLVTTLHEALSPAEQAQAQSQTGGAKVQESRRERPFPWCGMEAAVNHHRAGRANLRSVGADGTHWLLVVQPDNGWAILGDGERVAVGTASPASIDSGVRSFLSLTVSGEPQPGAAWA